MAHALTSIRVKHHLRREEGGTPREWNSGHTSKQEFASSDTRQDRHQSVLVDEVVRLLAPRDGEIVVDATAGAGGHSEALLKAASVRLIALDADPLAVAATKTRLARFGKRIAVVQSNFAQLDDILTNAGVEMVNAVLFDLGWRQEQLLAGKGFSFMHNEPLVMSYGEEPASGFTASQILNTWSEKAIADVLYGYGEERYARRIAKAVVMRRNIMPINTTFELVELIRDAVPHRYARGKLHVATRSFQALRVAVNDELGVLEKGLKAAWKHLGEGGRLVVISFHSIEDRLVKHLFREFLGRNGTLLTKKPITASRQEIIHNPSSRSAKLRGIRKNK